MTKSLAYFKSHYKKNQQELTFSISLIAYYPKEGLAVTLENMALCFHKKGCLYAR